MLRIPAAANEPRPKAYCGSCRGLFSPEGFRQAGTKEGFLHSRVARNGRAPGRHECTLCAFLDAKIFGRNLSLYPDEEHGAEEDGDIRFTARDTGALAKYEGDQAPVHKLDCRFIRDGRRARNVMIPPQVFHPIAEPESPAADFVSRRHLIPPHSQAAFDAAKSWLSTCLGEHGECGKSKDLRLPTRVLDVLSDRDAVALYAPVAFEEGQYACLSYCWGGDQEFVLTQATLGALCTGVSPGVLGRTIQDAIEVTRRLGLRYLWVDALCIIQDSDGDKDTELGRMGRIYLNSTVTIAAADAVSSTSGFLQVDGSNEQELVFEVPFQNGSIALYPCDGSSKTRRLEDYHLNMRAWTFQEMLLSPRILFYTRAELLWICEEDRMKQVSPTRYDYHASNSDRNLWHAVLDKAQRKEVFWNQWLSLVRFYTRRQTTFKQDRLRAIQALVETVETISGQRCLHGMWDRSLPYALSWKVLRRLSDQPAHRSPLGAPTWSWASVNGPVDMSECATEASVSVKLFCIREDHALGLEAILIPTSRTREHFPGTTLPVSSAYFPDLPGQPTDEAGTESFYMPLVGRGHAARFLEILRIRDDAFVRTGFLICYGPISDEMKDHMYRFETKRIWLA